MSEKIVQVDISGPVRELDKEYGDEIEIPIGQLIAVLSESLKLVPDQYREKAVFTVRAYGDYASASIGAHFERPETAEERAAREQKNQQYRDGVEAAERATYERLKAKFDSR